MTPKRQEPPPGEGRRGAGGVRLAIVALAGLMVGLLVEPMRGTISTPTSTTTSTTVGPADVLDGLDGVPVVDYGGDIGVQENPVTVAQWALDGGDLIAGADWLVDRQEADGSWRYDFDWSLSANRAHLEAGWPSGMAQGQAMSVLARAHERTGEDRYRQAATDAFRFLMVPVTEGGVAGELNGGLWFEEYPSDPPSYVLNGFLYTLNGLWDARELVPGALDAYQQGRDTLDANLWRWSRGGKVAYDLLHETTDNPFVWWNPTYDELHRDLLIDIQSQRPSVVVDRWLDRWFRAEGR